MRQAVCSIYLIDVNLPSGPGFLKLTTSLVNETLKFQMLISHLCQYFLLKKVSAKASLIFSTKNTIVRMHNNKVFGYKIVKHLTS